MEDLKVQVNNEAESREAIDFFELLEYEKAFHEPDIGFYQFLFAKRDGFITWNDDVRFFKKHYAKELTIQQLRDLVVLKRNDVGDATNTDQDGWKWYIGADSYVWQAGNSQQLKQWDQSSLCMVDLKPIEKEMKMKEYLDKDYVLRSVKQTTGDNRVPDGWIEVPDGAESLTILEEYVIFWKDGFKKAMNIDSDWINSSHTANGYIAEYGKEGAVIAWQRTETEKTKQPTGIEATLAERQATYGCFEDVARTTEQIMKALADPRINGLNELPYPHRMALYMIASKMARIVNGDFNHKDSWHDIGGYAKLVEDLL